VREYEIHRSIIAGFKPNASTRIGMADANGVVKASPVYGHVPFDHHEGEYDHMMFQDNAVEPATTYYYRVCAVDTAGQHGPFSQEAAVRTKAPLAPAEKVTAQSVYAPEYAPENAIDGDPDPYAAWISKPYGGGTKAKPLDVWWAIELSGGKRMQLKGVKIVGDDRPVIPLQRNLKVQVRTGGDWQTVGELKNAATKTVSVNFQQVVTTDALRIYVPAADLPKSDRAEQDGIVRLCELLLILPDGKESPVVSPPQP
jgi:hypothetical protein